MLSTVVTNNDPPTAEAATMPMKQYRGSSFPPCTVLVDVLLLVEKSPDPPRTPPLLTQPPSEPDATGTNLTAQQEWCRQESAFYQALRAVVG